jgi:16S rRNA (guanine966-N2)-methyltransferase
MTADGAGRVIAGTARGIRLEAPGATTRPLADRVKETLFAILEPDLPGAVVLDLFAGSGAAGIEALSRGAARAVFVERDKAAAAVIAENLARTHLGGERARIVRAEALAWLLGPDAAAAGPFDIVVADPPYAETDLLAAALDALGPHLAPGARVVAKHFWRDTPAQPGLLASERERRFGETSLTFYRRAEDR